MDYTTRTRQEWIDFDKARSKAFEPTQEEIDQQALEQEQARKQLIDSKLSSRWIIIPDILSKQWMLVALEWLNAKSFVWDDVEWWLDWQIELYWDIRSALDNLVITYL